jgi:hypothetical protein
MITSVYTTFRVEHFRLFSELSVELAPVTLISGRNNTGKTALLESVFLHASGPRAAHNALSALNTARGMPTLLGQPEGQTTWDLFFKNSNTLRPIRVTASFDNETATVALSRVNESFIPSGSASGQGSVAAGPSFSQSLKIEVTRNGSSEEYVASATQQPFGLTANNTPGNIQFGGVSLQLVPNAPALLAANILTSRVRAIQPELAQRYSDLRLLDRQEDFLDGLRVIDSRVRSVEVLVRDGQSGLHLNMNGRLMPLSLFGEGMAAAAEIISIIYSQETRVVLIDEIENGIHYSALQPFWQHIKNAAIASGTQVIATTHSRECLAAAYAAFAEDAASMLGLLRLSRLPGDSDDVIVTRYSTEEIESALDLNLDIR